MVSKDVVDTLKRIKGKVRNTRKNFIIARNDFLNKKENGIVCINQPLVLISQIQRSGGTLMSQLFDDHPECVAYPSEIEWGKPLKYNWPDIDFENMTAKKIYDCLHEEIIDSSIMEGYSKQSWLAPLRETFPFVFNRNLQKKIFLKLLRSNFPKNQRDVLNCYVTSFFNAWIDYQNLYRPNKKYVVGFTPRVNMYDDSSRRFFRDYKDGYMISIIRHPASWFASARKHNPNEFGDLENAIDLWISSVRSSLSLKETYGQRVILVLFENLINDTTKTMKCICEKIGLEWTKNLSVPTFNSMPIKADSSFKVKSHGIVKDTLKRHKKNLNNDEISIINKKAMPVYEESILSSI